jgi:hypothetical protein
MIRAKMSCDRVDEQTATAQKVGEVAYLSAVTSGSEENSSFSAATPHANLVMTISNPDAWGKIVEGQEYYIDITPATGG